MIFSCYLAGIAVIVLKMTKANMATKKCQTEDCENSKPEEARSEEAAPRVLTTMSSGTVQPSTDSEICNKY